jgi:hypothetical protein
MQYEIHNLVHCTESGAKGLRAGEGTRPTRGSVD